MATTRTRPAEPPAPEPPDVSASVMTELPARQPSNVVEALAAVMAEIGGVRKMTTAERQRLGLLAPSGGGGEFGVKYAYRGIDQLASAAQPLFGKYGIVTVPVVLGYEVRQVEVGGKPWDHMMVEVRYDIYGPNGSSLTAVVWGEGRDNSDKAMNKAMSVAYKNLLLRLLCIGDPNDDPDHERHETDGAHYVDPNPANAVKSAATVTFERVRSVGGSDPAIGEALKSWAKDQGDGGKPLSQNAFRDDDEWRLAVEAKLDSLVVVAEQDAAVEPAGEPAGETASRDQATTTTEET